MILFTAKYTDNKAHFLEKSDTLCLLYQFLNLIPIEEYFYIAFRNNLLLIHSLCMLESICFNITQ